MLLLKIVFEQESKKKEKKTNSSDVLSALVQVNPIILKWPWSIFQYRLRKRGKEYNHTSLC